MEGDQKRKMRMNVGREPCILYETVELLYAYINGISADRLTMDRVYCIPAPEIARLMGAACAGVDRQDPDFRRFFARRPILDCLLYTYPSPRDPNTSRIPSSA